MTSSFQEAELPLEEALARKGQKQELAQEILLAHQVIQVLFARVNQGLRRFNDYGCFVSTHEIPTNDQNLAMIIFPNDKFEFSPKSSSKSYLPTSSPNQIPRRPKAFTFDFDYDLGGLPPPPPRAGNSNGRKQQQLPRRGKSGFGEEEDEVGRRRPPSLKVEPFFPDPQPPHPLLFQVTLNSVCDLDNKHALFLFRSLPRSLRVRRNRPQSRRRDAPLRPPRRRLRPRRPRERRRGGGR